MNKQLNMLKLALNLPARYLQAKKALKENDDDKAQEIFKFMANKMIKATGREIEVINLNDNLDLNGSLILSNHQENFDIFAIVMAFKEKLRFVAKKELFNLFMFKTYIELNKSYPLDRKDAREGVKVFKNVVKDVNAGTNVVVFPEGTRSKCDVMLEFNSGLFNFFKRIKKPIIPVYIDGSYDDARKKVRVIIGKPIYNDQIAESTTLKDVVYQQICQLKKDFANNKKYNILGLGDSVTFGQTSDDTYQGGYYKYFVDKLERESLLKSAHNLAIPSFSIDNLISLIDHDNYQKMISKVGLESERVNKLIKANSQSIYDLIRKADYILLSVGANDILNNVTNLKVTKQKLYDEYKNMYDKLMDLVAKISKINQNVKIIYVGQYFPYPHSKALLKFDYIKALDMYINRLEINNMNLTKVIISQEVFEHRKVFLPNKRNIHLSQEGYHFVYEKVLKAFIKNVRAEYGY